MTIAVARIAAHSAASRDAAQKNGRPERDTPERDLAGELGGARADKTFRGSASQRRDPIRRGIDPLQVVETDRIVARSRAGRSER